MKKKLLFKRFCLFCIVCIASRTIYAQGTGTCIYSLFPIANTSNTITLSNPSPLPVAGIYNLTLTYYDVYNDNQVEPPIHPVAVSIIGSQLIITDNAIIYPTMQTNDYDFSNTYGMISLSSTTNGSYYLKWDMDQIADCVVLPVTLISFAAQLNTSTSIKLVWQTAAEANLSSYVIERSPDLAGYCFTSIGQVAPLNTSVTHNYQFIDFSPYRNTNFYRLKTVNNDGKIKYSQVSSINCSNCTTNPPPLNCSSVSISGPSSVCTTDIFSLSGVTSCGGATWSISPASTATIVGNHINSLNAKVTKTTNGIATITAKIPGCSNTYTKTITLGPPALTTSIATYITQSYTQYVVTVSNPTAAPASYSWTSNGGSVGTGLSKTYYVYSGSSINYSVNLNTTCGTSSAGGYLYYQAPVNPCGPVYVTKLIPASGQIVVGIQRCPVPQVQPLITTDTKISSPDDYELRLLDFSGTVIKNVNHVSLKDTYSLDIRGVKPGNYSLLIIIKGVTDYSQKLRVD